jgi:ferric-dicitrate binding protein FerR (iron transport regulator)
MSEALFEKYVHDTLTLPEREDLKRLLASEEGSRQFIAFIREWSLLADVSRQMAGAHRLVASAQARNDKRGRPAPAQRKSWQPLPRASVPEAGGRRRWAAGVALAAAILFAITALALFIQMKDKPEPPILSTADLDGIADPFAATGMNPELPSAEPTPFVTDLPQPPEIAGNLPVPPVNNAAPPPVSLLLPEEDPLAVAPPISEPSQDPESMRPEQPTAVTASPERQDAPSPDGLVPATLPSLATLEGLRGRVSILVPGREAAPARPDLPLLAGQGLQTVGADSGATIRFPDASRLELGPNTVLNRLTAGRADGEKQGAGKEAYLDRGLLTAVVADQPPSRPLVVHTPHADARILGTRLTLVVSAGATRLDVDQGRVQFTRQRDGATVEVAAGQYVATDAPGALTVRNQDRPKGTDVVRMIDDLEGPLRWTRFQRTASIEFAPSRAQAHAGRQSLLVSFNPPEKEFHARGVLIRPLRLTPVDRALRFHLRVVQASGKPEWTVGIHEKDGNYWRLGNGSFEAPPAAFQAWNPIEVPLPDASSKPSRRGSGNDRYEPESVETLILTVGGGRVSFYLDTLLVVESSAR